MIHLTNDIAAVIHQLLEMAAMILGVGLYRKRNTEALKAASFYLVLACIIGAGLGNKLLHQLQHPEQWSMITSHWQLIFSGQSLLGGLIGGWLGVELVKYYLGIKIHRRCLRGAFVCCHRPWAHRLLFAGLNEDTYGAATDVPWGINLGDGVNRHPAPLYEALWALVALLIIPTLARRLSWPSGSQFRIFLPPIACGAFIAKH